MSAAARGRDVIRVGTRGSALALAQTKQIAERLGAAADADIEIVTVTTQGDTSRASLQTIGGTGVFAAALREALIAGECDVVVHSLKDLPTAEHPGVAQSRGWASALALAGHHGGRVPAPTTSETPLRARRR